MLINWCSPGRRAGGTERKSRRQLRRRLDAEIHTSHQLHVSSNSLFSLLLSLSLTLTLSLSLFGINLDVNQPSRTEDLNSKRVRQSKQRINQSARVKHLPATGRSGSKRCAQRSNLVFCRFFCVSHRNLHLLKRSSEYPQRSREKEFASFRRERERERERWREMEGDGGKDIINCL